MFIGKPIIYIGPHPSHITDILDECPGNISVNHGDSDMLLKKILEFTMLSEEEKNAIGERNMQYAQIHFHPTELISKMVNVVDQVS